MSCEPIKNHNIRVTNDFSMSKKNENHDLSAQQIFPNKRYTTYECIPELVVTVPASDATIYCPNDISSQYWPYRIIPISSRKISKFRYIVIVSISATRRRCCLFIFFFIGNKSRTAHIMTLKCRLARRPNRNSTMLGLTLKYRPLYNSLN